MIEKITVYIGNFSRKQVCLQGFRTSIIVCSAREGLFQTQNHRAADMDDLQACKTFMLLT